EVAAAHIYLAVERQDHRGAGLGPVKVTFHRHDTGDPRRLAGACHHDGIARLDDAAGDRAGIAAEARVGPVYPLDRKTERPADVALRHLHRLEELEERRPLMPGRVLASGDDIVPETGG